jgi:opacity protein-like surface antigen
MNKIVFGLALLLVGTVAFGQVAEVSVSGGVSRLSNNDLGSGYTLDNGFRLAIRGTFNMGRFLGHEVGYAYNRTALVSNGSSQGTSIHQGGYNFLAYGTHEGSRVRPFATVGGHFSNFVVPGYSATSGGGQNKFGFNYGGGVKAKVSGIFGVRLDVRQYQTGKPFDLGGTGRLKQTEISAGVCLFL